MRTRRALSLITLLCCVASAPTARARAIDYSPPRAETAETATDQAAEYFAEGVRLMKAGRYADAARNFDAATRYRENFAEAFSNLGYCHRKLKQYDRALGAYKSAIRMNPRLEAAHEYLGEAYAEMSLQYKALAERQLAILRKLNSPEADRLAAFLEDPGNSTTE